jgi:purine-binding chemotaxis protein CheW
MAAMDTSDHEHVLVVCTGARVCAIPLAIVEEIMRPLATDALPGVPPFLRGLAVIRGAPVPVLDLGRLLGTADAPLINRFVLLRLNGRRAAVAVEAVPGLRALGCSLLSLSRMLEEANPALVAGVSVSDRHLLFVLEVARIIPDGLWQELESRGMAS